jgi:hypothetical protein
MPGDQRHVRTSDHYAMAHDQLQSADPTDAVADLRRRLREAGPSDIVSPDSAHLDRENGAQGTSGSLCSFRSIQPRTTRLCLCEERSSGENAGGSRSDGYPLT